MAHSHWLCAIAALSISAQASAETPAETFPAKACVPGKSGIEVIDARKAFDGRRFIADGSETIPVEQRYPETGSGREAAFYKDGSTIVVMGAAYMKMGFPVVLEPSAKEKLDKTTRYQGHPLYQSSTGTSKNALAIPDTLYLQVRPECEFQPYAYIGQFLAIGGLKTLALERSARDIGVSEVWVEGKAGEKVTFRVKAADFEPTVKVETSSDTFVRKQGKKGKEMSIPFTFKQAGMVAVRVYNYKSEIGSVDVRVEPKR